VIVAVASLRTRVAAAGITGCPVVEVEELRAACLAAVGAVLAADPEVLVGGWPSADEVTSAKRDVGRSLLNEYGVGLPVEHVVVAADAPTAECRSLGHHIAARTERSLLVMADGSAAGASRRGIPGRASGAVRQADRGSACRR